MLIFKKNIYDRREISPDQYSPSSNIKYNELFAREAKKYGVPVCCVVLSWDNTSGMGMPGYEPDYVIAWTANMRKELIDNWRSSVNEYPPMEI